MVSISLFAKYLNYRHNPRTRLSLLDILYAEYTTDVPSNELFKKKCDQFSSAIELDIISEITRRISLLVRISDSQS